MPLRLTIKKKYSCNSERVKCIDFHPNEPWILSALYSGLVMISNYDTQTLVKTLQVCSLPIRSAKFIARKQWIITASDDLHVRIFNYNTLEKIHAFEAHGDYIRYIEIHPTLSYIFSCSDDMLVKCWDWNKSWNLVQTFEGHSHYVMMCKVNPKDTNTFATASLDRTIKVWGVHTSQSHFTLEGHDRGVNCIDYYPGGDKPYLISGSDDKTIKIWDYQTKTIIQSLEGHTHNLTCVAYHPRLPLILSASEDGTVRLWHSITYRNENTLNYGMERAWYIHIIGSKIGIGYDDGTVVLRLGHDQPMVTMDRNGKVIWANNNEIYTTTVKGLLNEMEGMQGISGISGTSAAATEFLDGEKLSVAVKDLGSCELYPQYISHNTNGRYIVVAGDGEYIIYTSQQLRNKSFGQGADFAWSPTGTGDYAVRENNQKLKLYKNFNEYKSIKSEHCNVEGIVSGMTICVKGIDCLVMYDWDEFRFIRKIDIQCKHVYWNERGDCLVIASDQSYYVLKFHKDLVQASLNSPTYDATKGIDNAFELVYEIKEKVVTGEWTNDCFVYTNSSQQLNYMIAGQVNTIAHLECKLYLLGYLPKENHVFLMDKSYNIYSYSLNWQLVEYQCCIVRQDMASAEVILQKITNPEQLNQISKFLQKLGYNEEALKLAKNPELRFDLAIQLCKLELAKEIMLGELSPIKQSAPTARVGKKSKGKKKKQDEREMTVEIQHKWKQLSDLALQKGHLDLMEECSWHAEDYNTLLLLYSSLGNRDKFEKLAKISRRRRRYNVSFLSYFMIGKVYQCAEILAMTDRIPEAAFFAKSYCPSMVPIIVQYWKENDTKSKGVRGLANPSQHKDLFPGFDNSIMIEKLLMEKYYNSQHPGDQGESIQVAVNDIVKKAINLSQRDNVDGLEMIRKTFKDLGIDGNNNKEGKMEPARHVQNIDASKRTQLAQSKPQEGVERRYTEDTDLQARREADLKAKHETELKAKHDAELKAKYEAELKAKHDAELKAKHEEELKAKQEADLKAKKEAELIAKQETERRLLEEAALKAKQEADLKAKKEAELIAKQEAERRLLEEAALKAKHEAELKLRQEAEKRLRVEAAARQEKEETERKQKEFEAQKRIQEEMERRLKAEKERKIKEEEQQRNAEKAQLEAARRLEEEKARLLKEETERLQRQSQPEAKSDLPNIIDTLSTSSLQNDPFSMGNPPSSNANDFFSMASTSSSLFPHSNTASGTSGRMDLFNAPSSNNSLNLNAPSSMIDLHPTSMSMSMSTQPHSQSAPTGLSSPEFNVTDEDLEIDSDPEWSDM